MTLEELQQCHGYSVQVSLDDRDALADVHIAESENARPALLWPAPLNGPCEDVKVIPLSDADIEAFRMNGATNIFSTIRLSSEGERHRIPGFTDARAANKNG
jgi:hypothetical protein